MQNTSTYVRPEVLPQQARLLLQQAVVIQAHQEAAVVRQLLIHARSARTTLRAISMRCTRTWRERRRKGIRCCEPCKHERPPHLTASHLFFFSGKNKKFQEDYEKKSPVTVRMESRE